MKTLRFGIVAPALVCAPAWLAEPALAAAGLRLKWMTFGATDLVSKALAAGRIDVALSTPEGAIVDALKGGPTRIAAGFANRPPLTMVARPPFRSLADLRGARIGTTSMTEGTRHIAEAMLAKAGLTYPADYAFVLSGAHPQRWTALQAGEIDAAAQMTPFEYMAEAAGCPLLGQAEDFVPRFAFCTLNTRQTWAANHGEELSVLLRAMRIGMDLFHHDPLRATAAIMNKLRMPEAMAARSLESFRTRRIFDPELDLDRQALDSVVHALRRSGLVGRAAEITPEDVLVSV